MEFPSVVRTVLFWNPYLVGPWSFESIDNYSLRCVLYLMDPAWRLERCRNWLWDLDFEVRQQPAFRHPMGSAPHGLLTTVPDYRPWMMRCSSKFSPEMTLANQKSRYVAPLNIENDWEQDCKVTNNLEVFIVERVFPKDTDKTDYKYVAPVPQAFWFAPDCNLTLSFPFKCVGTQKTNQIGNWITSTVCVLLVTSIYTTDIGSIFEIGKLLEQLERLFQNPSASVCYTCGNIWSQEDFWMEINYRTCCNRSFTTCMSAMKLIPPYQSGDVAPFKADVFTRNNGNWIRHLPLRKLWSSIIPCLLPNTNPSIQYL